VVAQDGRQPPAFVREPHVPHDGQGGSDLFVQAFMRVQEKAKTVNSTRDNFQPTIDVQPR
jgi:hypothetical protein